MKIVNSENGHLFYVVDEDNKIVYLSVSKEKCEQYLLRRER
jgi:ribosomal protein L24E